VRVPAVCAYPEVGKPALQEVASHNKAPLPPSGWAHRSKRFLTRLVPPIPGLWLCFTHSNCVCNEIVSAANRVVGAVPEPTADGLKRLRKFAKVISGRLPTCSAWSYDQVIALYGGVRRARYEQARDHIRSFGLVKWMHARISSFVKAEKFNPEDKKNPDPRMIQARTAEYGLEVATYLKPIEHHLYKLRGPMGLRAIAKGLNQRQRAELLARKLQNFDRPVIFSLDASRWDKHVARSVLAIEHGVYMHCNADPYFAQLLSWQLHNKCRAMNGVKYSVRGGRMSGDMNTALGNCLLMVIMVHAAMDWCKKWDLLDDGDDCLVICEETDFEQARETLPKVFLTFGQELKIENVARDIRDVQFCQCRVVVTESGPIFTRNWRRCLSQDACGSKHWDDPKMVRSMCAAVGRCNLALSQGMPILQEYCLALIRFSGGAALPQFETDRGLAIKVKLETGLLQHELGDISPLPISDFTRLEFERTWGVTVPEQHEIERLLASWSYASLVPVDYPLERSANWESFVALENELPFLL